MATNGNDPMHPASSSTPASATTRAIIQRLTASSSPLNDANRLVGNDCGSPESAPQCGSGTERYMNHVYA